MTDSTQLFTQRADNYAKYRPSYPPAVLECLRQECSLTSTTIIADIGSGTGILTELFLKNGNQVFGVEPNEAMRQTAETALAEYPHFTSVVGRAEETTLTADSIDLVTAGQAFHWFAPYSTKIEFRRILRPKGLVALVWNQRSLDGSPFMQAYELLSHQYALNYRPSQQEQEGHEQMIQQFFNGKIECREFSNEQHFDFEGLAGRHLSSSYTPMAGHALYEPMQRDLHHLFDTFQENNQVHFLYNTRLYFGPIAL